MSTTAVASQVNEPTQIQQEIKAPSQEKDKNYPQGKEASQPKTFTTIDAHSLLQRHFPPLQFAVEKILPHGLFILAGSSKIGKSWLSLDICRAVASGDEVLEFGASKGEVLYLALEDNYRRLYNRLQKIELMANVTPEEVAELNEHKKLSNLEGFHMTTAAFGIGSGLIEQVHNFMAVHPNVKLLVIDTLERVRDTALDKGIYACDYRDMTALREITDKYELTLLLIHHTRKLSDGDPLNTLSGSTGLTGAVDGVFVLQKEKRISNKAILTICNRDTDEYCFDLEFNRENCKWVLKGDHEDNKKESKGSKEDEQANKNEWLCLLVDDFLRDSWSGTATELTKALNDIDGSGNTDITHLNVKRQLLANAELLASSGITVGEERNDSQRLIKLNRHS